MTKHAESARGTRDNGQRTAKDLTSKHLKITNETIRAPYVDELTRLHNVLIEMDEPIADRRFFAGIVLQGLTEDLGVNIPQIQSVLRRFYLGRLPRNETGTIVGRGTAMATTIVTNNSSV